jgi:hypothetical protein
MAELIDDFMLSIRRHVVAPKNSPGIHRGLKIVHAVRSFGAISRTRFKRTRSARMALATHALGSLWLDS